MDADIFVSGKNKLRIQKYLDTCGRGIPKIYEPLSESESEQELEEHYMMKMLFFPRVRRKTNSNHFENFCRTLFSSAVKLHCIDVAPLNVDKKKVNT